MAISLGENPDPELAGVQLSIISMWASGSSFDVSQQGDLANDPACTKAMAGRYCS
jgi:hypothetical protein